MLGKKKNVHPGEEMIKDIIGLCLNSAREQIRDEVNQQLREVIREVLTEAKIKGYLESLVHKQAAWSLFQSACNKVAQDYQVKFAVSSRRKKPVLEGKESEG
jgi:hypothetical protein